MSKGKPRPAYGLRPSGGATGGGGGGGMAGQLQKLQEEFAKTQDRLGDETVEVTVGGGMVKAVMTGQQKLMSITISPDAVDPDDVEMLQDMILAAINEAVESHRAGRREDGRADRWAANPWVDVAMAQTLARPVANLIEILSRLPGIGPKTASRLTFYLLREPNGLALALAEALEALTQGRSCASAASTSLRPSPCPICADRRVISGRFASWKSRWTCWRSSARALSRRIPRAARRAVAHRRHLSRETEDRRAGRSRAHKPARAR